MAKKKCTLTKSEFDALQPALEKAITDRLSGIKPIGAPPAGTDVFDDVVEIDSKLVATEVQPVVTKVLGEEFPLKLIQKGGYETPGEAVQHLLSQLRSWCRPDESIQVGAAAP